MRNIFQLSFLKFCWFFFVTLVAPRDSLCAWKKNLWAISTILNKTPRNLRTIFFFGPKISLLLVVLFILLNNLMSSCLSGIGVLISEHFADQSESKRTLSVCFFFSSKILEKEYHFFKAPLKKKITCFFSLKKMT